MNHETDPLGSGCQVIDGHLDWYSETGSEGVHWVVTTDYHADERSVANAVLVRDGDYLTIWAEDGEVLWEGTVDLDQEVGSIGHPGNPEYRQQAVAGLWVNGIQRGIAPETWADWYWGHELVDPDVRAVPRTHPLRARLLRFHGESSGATPTHRDSPPDR